MFFSVTTIAITLLSIGFAAMASYLLARLWFTWDQRFEDNVQRPAMKVSGTLKTLGLVRLPEMLDCIAIKDWSGLYTAIREFSILCLNPTAVVLEFDNVFKNVLTRKLAAADGRAMIAGLLADAVKADDPAATKAVTAVATTVSA